MLEAIKYVVWLSFTRILKVFNSYFLALNVVYYFFCAAFINQILNVVFIEF